MSSFARTRAEREFSALCKSQSITTPQPSVGAPKTSMHLDGPNTLHLSYRPAVNEAGAHQPRIGTTPARVA